MAHLLLGGLAPSEIASLEASQTNGKESVRYRFGEFRLCIGQRQLWYKGEPVGLTPRAMDLLIALVEVSGRVVERAELLRRVWRDVSVHDSNLTVNLCLLRRALGSNDRMIATVPGRGYQFVAPVIAELNPPAITSAEAIRAQWLAIAPVQRMGEPQAHAALGDALLPALVVALARLPGLRVRASRFETSAEADWRLEISYQETGAKLRVTAQLIHTADAGVEWAGQRQFPAAAAFEVQDRIAAWLKTIVVRILT